MVSCEDHFYQNQNGPSCGVTNYLTLLGVNIQGVNLKITSVSRVLL